MRFGMGTPADVKCILRIRTKLLKAVQYSRDLRDPDLEPTGLKNPES
jgi:hypothetical protein